MLAFACLQLLLSGGALLGGFQDSLARRSAASAFGLQGFPRAPIWKHPFSLSAFLSPPWINAVQLEPARCLLATSLGSLPTQLHRHFQSLQYYASCQVRPSCPALAWLLDTAAQSWVELSPWGSGSLRLQNQWLSSSSWSMALEMFANHQLGTIPSLSSLSPFPPSS